MKKTDETPTPPALALWGCVVFSVVLWGHPFWSAKLALSVVTGYKFQTNFILARQALDSCSPHNTRESQNIFLIALRCIGLSPHRWLNIPFFLQFSLKKKSPRKPSFPSQIRYPLYFLHTFFRFSSYNITVLRAYFRCLVDMFCSEGVI
jgi:hypothetical protein